MSLFNTKNLLDFFYTFIVNKPKSTLLDRLDKKELNSVSDDNISKWLEKSTIEEKLLLSEKLGLSWSLVFWDKSKTKTNEFEKAIAPFKTVDVDNIPILIDKKVFAVDSKKIIRKLITTCQISASKILKIRPILKNDSHDSKQEHITKRIEGNDTDINTLIGIILGAYDISEYLTYHHINHLQFRILLSLYKNPNGYTKRSLRENFSFHASTAIKGMHNLNYVEYGENSTVFIDTMGAYVVKDILKRILISTT